MTLSNGNTFRVTGILCSHEGQWRGALMFSLICAWTNDWVNNRNADDLRRHRSRYDVNVMNTKRIPQTVHSITLMCLCINLGTFTKQVYQVLLEKNLNLGVWITHQLLGKAQPCNNRVYIYDCWHWAQSHMHSAGHDDVIKWKHFRVTGHLCGEFTSHRWILRTKACDAELWGILWSAPD